MFVHTESGLASAPQLLNLIFDTVDSDKLNAHPQQEPL